MIPVKCEMLVKPKLHRQTHDYCCGISREYYGSECTRCNALSNVIKLYVADPDDVEI